MKYRPKKLPKFQEAGVVPPTVKRWGVWDEEAIRTERPQEEIVLPDLTGQTQYFQTDNGVAYDANNATYEQAAKAEQFTTVDAVRQPGTNNPVDPNPPVQRRNPWQNFMNMRMGVLAANEISGRIERNRQDQYHYNQLSTMGQMNPMPVEDFQPNPFSLYARYGGNIKKYMNVKK